LTIIVCRYIIICETGNIRSDILDKNIQIYELQAEICRSLADPKRLMIISALSDGEKSVGELGAALGLRQANVSQHLTVLRSNGLVNTRREGVTIYYSLRSPKIARACGLVHEVLMDSLEKNQALISGIRKARLPRANAQPAGKPSEKERINASI